MAIFEEKKTGQCGTILLLALLFVLSYPFWHLGDYELFGNEAEYAVALTEMQFWPPVTLGHGHLLENVYPLFLVGAKALMLCGLPAALAQRGLVVQMYFVLTALVFFINRRNFGLQAASAAAAVMFTTVFSFDRLPDGYPMVITALLVYGGWMVWIEFCLVRANWDLAWIFAGLFASLIFYNDGVTGLLYFLIPIAMQRRPLTIWQKINRRGFYAGAGILAVTILFWFVPQENFPADPQKTQTDFLTVDFIFGEYLHRLMTFPFNTFGALLPWSLLMWAPFCAALETLDENPQFGKIHRIFFVTLLLLIWFNPESRVRDVFLLMPLMATMIGTNYWILVRRYGGRMSKICMIGCWGLLIAAGVAALFYFQAQYAPTWMRKVFAFITSAFGIPGPDGLVMFAPLRAAFELGTVLLLGISALILIRRRYPVWLSAAVLFTGISLFFWAAVCPVTARDRSKHVFAEEQRRCLQDHLPPGEPLYSAVYGLFAEGYYAGIPLRHVEAGRLPENAAQVFVISDGVPADTRRLWTKVHEIEYKKNRLLIYRGQIIRSDDNDDDI